MRHFPPHVHQVAPADAPEARCPDGRQGALGRFVAAGWETGVRYHKTFSALAAALLAFAPVQAFAQDAGEDTANVQERPRPEYDPLGRPLGGFDLHANVELGVESTNNLFATETAEQDDIIYSVAPNARLASHWSRHALAIAAGGVFTSHQDFSSEDAETGYLRASGRLDIGSDSAVLAELALSDEVESRTDPDSLGVSQLVDFSRSRVAVTARHSLNRFRLSGTLSTQALDFSDAGAIDQDFRDRTDTAGTARVEFALNPRVSMLASVTADDREYDNAPGLTSDGRTYLAGIRVDLTNLIQGELAVGQFDRSYDNGDSIDGTAISGNVEWYITRLTTVTLRAGQEAQESGATTLSPYVNTLYGVRVDHELLRNLILSAGIRRDARDYQDIDREDEATYADAGAEWLLNRRIALNARYVHEENDSEGVDAYRDFSADRFYVGVNFRL